MEEIIKIIKMNPGIGFVEIYSYFSKNISATELHNIINTLEAQQKITKELTGNNYSYYDTSRTLQAQTL